MPTAHTVVSEAGYPRYFAEQLASRGLTVEFSDRFTPTFEGLPRTWAELREHVKLTGPPDLVLLQIGTHYSYRTVLGPGERRDRVRDRLSRALGQRVFVAYKLLGPVVRRLGRPYREYHGVDELDAFIELIREEWPQAQLVAIGLFPVMSDGTFDPAVQDRVSREMLSRARHLGVPILDMEPVLAPDPALYCANGAQLNTEGSRVAADALLDWWGLRQVGGAEA